ncbi:MAG TPA: hypothetical protein VFH44_04420 [Solirubrobacterales bacterium]|nr:hypothetical protein [Solirubrobacterales bacterium]
MRVPGRSRRLRAFEDRLTRVLTPTAALATGAVVLGEMVRRYRRRIADRHGADAGGVPRADSPVEALELAGLASQDTVRVAVTGYRVASRSETALFNLFVGFVGASLLARVSSLGIREGWWPFGNVRLGGRHIHHFVPGILLAFGSGAAGLVSESESIETALAIPFGAGVGLTLDEAALLLDLRDVYWSREGVLSVQVTLAAVSFLGAAILGLRMLQQGETRVSEQGRMPG